ncbi:MAG: plasmid pRiA4b ORF-3 family protein [Candidatus Azobacteroides sp.]|nr:plasmid pRiA4b ORF-3 family protein [Candidatus Azobacteroides sp.]
MVYKFVLISDEVDGFSREIEIDADATFFDLHEAVLNSVNYSKDQITSFFLCNDDWEKETEITLFKMDTDSDVDSWVMNEAVLSELISDEKQKLIYIFDNLNERMFFMELVEILFNKELPAPKCVSSAGDPPPQMLENNDIEDILATSDFGENFYGDEDFDPEELDHGDDFDDFEDGGHHFEERY